MLRGAGAARLRERPHRAAGAQGLSRLRSGAGPGPTLTRNRKMSSRNSRRDYLLRGVVTCSRPASGPRRRGAEGAAAYRCLGIRPGEARSRCAALHGRGIISAAAALETAVWDARQGVCSASANGTSPRRSARDREQLQDAESAGRRAAAACSLSWGRWPSSAERVLGLYRRGRITTEEVTAISRRCRDREALERQAVIDRGARSAAMAAASSVPV